MRKIIIKFILVGVFIFMVSKYGINISFSQEIGKTAEDYFLEGQEYLERGDYERANEIFKKAQYLIEGNTNKKPGGIIEKQKEPRILVTENSTDSKHDKTTLEKAKEAYLNKDWDTALKLYTLGLSKFKHNSDIKYNLGVISLRKFDYLNAAKYFEQAVYLNYKDSNAYYNLGIIYEKYLDNNKKAIMYYRKYLKFVANKEDKIRVEKWIDHIDKYGKIR